MAQGNNAKREGARSNELYQLQALNRIVTAVGPLATESTLLSVLQAIIASDQDIEILLVRDEAVGNGNPVLKQVTNYETGVPVVTYENVDGTTYVPTPNPVPVYVYLDPSAVLNLMLTELLTLNAGGPLATETTLGTVNTNLGSINTNIQLSNIELANILTALNGSATEVTQLLVDTSTSTLATPVTGLGMTLGIFSGSSGITSAGKRSISILNSGANTATVGGGTPNNLPPGVEVTWEAGGLRDTLGVLTWDATGTTLIISTVG